MRRVISEEEMKRMEQKFHEDFREAAMNPPSPDIDTIFKLIVVTIDRDYDDEGNPLLPYPSFKVDATECYYCRTLVKAERIMRRRVIKERKKKERNEEVHNKIYCFYITELPLEHKITEYVPGEYLTCRAYDANGLLADKSKAGNICLREDIKTECTHLSYPLFRGRSEEEIRFKPGDIVEVMDGTDIRLAVITGIPPTIEQCWEYHMRLKSLSLEPECRKRPHHYMRDYSDDSYIIVDSAPNNQLYHEHVNSIFVFTPRFPIPVEVEQKFKRAFEEWKAL
ncbi:MAG: hypothetical protein IKJ95_07665 [Bacteroidaceae bacterium]|nr:hypothetical protein [Bacteroidaceae bacterium]